jgi:propanediol dehydratase small subunit
MIIIPVLAALTLGIATVKAVKKKKLTPEQLRIYRAALGEEEGVKGLSTSAQLRELSRAFRAQGFKEQADTLEKRASLKDIPDEVKLQYRNIMRVALNSLDRPAVLKVAAEFEKKGATGAANVLRNHAATLDSLAPKKRVQKKSVPAEEPESSESSEVVNTTGTNIPEDKS